MASPANSDKRRSDSEEEGSSGDDQPLFKFAPREFRPKAASDEDSDGSGSGKASSNSDDSDSDGAFNSSPDNRSRGALLSTLEARRARGGAVAAGSAAGGARAGSADDSFTLDSSDDDNQVEPPQQRRRLMDPEEMQAEARRRAEEMIASGGGGSVSRDAAHERKRQANLRIRMELEAASRVEPLESSLPSMGYRGRLGSGAGSGSVPAMTVPVTSEFKRNRVANKVIALTVSRGTGQKKHVFKTKPAREVEAILLACRKEFLTLEEEEQDVVLSLYRGDKLLDSEKSLMDAGVTEDVELRLEVKGDDGGSLFSGPSISLRVRVECAGSDGKPKTFTVETTQDTKFYAFMESFCVAVGIPEGRAQEVAFEFDGDKLNPEGTPEAEDMDEDDLVDAKVPADLNSTVADAPSVLKLKAKAKNVKKKPKKATAATAGGKGGKGSKGGGSSPRAAAAAGQAIPSVGRQTRSTRSTRSSSRSSGSSGSAASMADDAEVVVLSD